MRRAVLTLLAAATLTAGLAAPAQASGRHRDRDDRCRHDCERSDKHDDDSRMYCIMPCVVIVPMPTSPGPEAQAEPALPPAVVCAPFHCDPKPSAMFPPDPARLAELIQAFASGLGKSVGDLAGAIAAFPPALLL